MNNDNIEQWKQRLTTDNDIQAIFKDVKNLKGSNGKFTGLCPFHAEKTPSFSITKDKGIILYHCFSCGEAGNIIQYIQKTENVDFNEAVKRIADLTNRDLPEGFLSGNQRTAKEKTPLEIANEYFLSKKELAREYLESRYKDNDPGFIDWLIDNDYIGFYDSKEALKKHFQDNGINDITKTGIHDLLIGRIIFTYKDRNKNIISLTGRKLNNDDNDKTGKYVNHSGAELTDFYNADNIPHNPKNLIVCEGFFDCLRLTYYGFENVIATGTNRINNKQIALLKNNDKINSITLYINADNAGDTGAYKTIKALINDKDIYVLPLPANTDISDVDEYITKHGIDKFNEYKDKAILPAGKWVIKYLTLWQKADKVDIKREINKDDFNEIINKIKKEKNKEQFKNAYTLNENDIYVLKTINDDDKKTIKDILKSITYKYLIHKNEKDRKEALNECKQFIASLKKHTDIKEANNILQSIYQEYDIDFLTSEILRDRETKNYKQDFKNYNDKLKEFLDNGDLEQAEKLEKPARPLINIIPLDDYLNEKHKRELNRNTDELLGYKLTEKFKRLEKNLDGIQQGLYIIGAKYNAGKTAFLCNLFDSLIKANSDLTGLYISLDDNKDIIINRLIAIKTGIELNQVQKKQVFPGHQDKINEAYEYLIDLYRANRINIKDISECNNVNTLKSLIIQTNKKANNKLFIVIDGLYNLDVNAESDDTRKENIERANVLKQLSDVFKIPVIATAELRKKNPGKDSTHTDPTPDDLMETGKFAYNANLVLLLSYETKDEITKEEATLKMQYAKNKLSSHRNDDYLTFNRKCSIITEMDKPGSKEKSKDDLQDNKRKLV